MALPCHGENCEIRIEIYDTCVDFNGDFELDIYVYNMLIRKASCWDFMFIVP